MMTRFSRYIYEDDRLNCITCWPYQRQMLGIGESMDTQVEVRLVNNGNEIVLIKFMVSGEQYTFEAYRVGDKSYSIGFYNTDNIGDDEKMFALTGNSDTPLYVMAGVFRSIEMLLRVREVNTLSFRSDMGHKKFYDKMEKWVEKRFPFKIHNKSHSGKEYEWVYKRVKND